MDRISGSIRRRLFGIERREVTFARRGFWADSPAAVAQLERAGASFVDGYHLALHNPGSSSLGVALDRVESQWRGFAFEGAGMALALLDLVTPWNRSRLATFLEGPGEAHVYMVTIGAGWAWARMGPRLARIDTERRRLDPILGWIALDGFGFHEGYFHTERTVVRQTRPDQIGGYGARVFDTGVGRSLWFVEGANPERVAAQVGEFAPDRHADLWAGLGLAATYACGVSNRAIDRLVELSGAHRGSLAQGSAFAAKARRKSCAAYRSGCDANLCHLA